MQNPNSPPDAPYESNYDREGYKLEQTGQDPTAVKQVFVTVAAWCYQSSWTWKENVQ